MPSRSVTLRSNDWETIEWMWGLGMPTRHIRVFTPGIRLRKKTGPFGGNGSPTPACVNYGGGGAIGVQTIQVKGSRGQRVDFFQGVGDCSG